MEEAIGRVALCADGSNNRRRWIHDQTPYSHDEDTAVVAELSSSPSAVGVP